MERLRSTIKPQSGKFPIDIHSDMLTSPAKAVTRTGAITPRHETFDVPWFVVNSRGRFELSDPQIEIVFPVRDDELNVDSTLDS